MNKASLFQCGPFSYTIVVKILVFLNVEEEMIDGT